MKFSIPGTAETFTIDDEWWSFCESKQVDPIFRRFVCRDSEDIVAITTIRPPKRSDGIPSFNKQRLVAILCAIVGEEDALPAVQVRALRDDPTYQYEVVNGFHRFYASIAVGFVEIPIKLSE